MAAVAICAYPDPALLIVMLSTSTCPDAVIPTVTDGATNDWPDIACQLKLIVGADA